MDDSTLIGSDPLILLGSAALALCTPLASSLLLRSLRCCDPLRTNQIEGAGAIVVIGADLNSHAPEFDGYTVGRLTLERIRYAAHLHRRTGLPICVSGGNRCPNSGQPLAAAMRQVLEDEFGVDVRWEERDSRNTWENAVFGQRILRREGIGAILLVTHAWHMRRARRSFEDQGLAVTPAATGFSGKPTPILRDFVPSVWALRSSALAIHEWLGVLWYKVARHREVVRQSPPLVRRPRSGG